MPEQEHLKIQQRTIADYILIFGCAILLGAALGFVLWYAKGALSWETLILAGLFTIVCLATGFDSFQLGQLLTISREKNIAQEDAKEAKATNEKLFAQLLQFTSNMHSNQNVQQTFQIGTPKVELASEQEKEAAKEDIQESAPLTQTPSPAPPESTPVDSAETQFQSFEQRRRVIALMEGQALQAFTQARSNASISLKEVKITGLADSPDPISTREVIFDGYLKEDTRESFIEVMSTNSITPFRLDRIYVQIARVYFYKMAKGVDASLVLLVIDFPGAQGVSPISRRYVSQLPDRFRPALLSGLLRIEWMNFTQEQVDEAKAKDGTFA